MRFFVFIMFLSAILYSEIGSHIMIWDNEFTVEFDVTSDESNENESNEENSEDSAEEDKLFEQKDFYVFLKVTKSTDMPYAMNILYSQSPREVHSPPPDLV